MSDQDLPPEDSTPPRLPDTPHSGVPLPPGAGSPVQPGPPLSVQAPIRDTTLNLGALLLGAGVLIGIVLVVLVLISAFSHH